jgi:hypothetical protein
VLFVFGPSQRPNLAVRSAVALVVAASFGCAQAKMVDTAIACPLALPMAAPKNAVLFGGKNLSGASLWNATVVNGTTSEAKIEFAKNPASAARAEIQSDQAENGEGPVPQKDGTLMATYTYRPTKTDVPGKMEAYMLACRYAKTNLDSLTLSPKSALLLIQLPAARGGVCKILDQKPSGTTARPLKQASCTGK